MKIDLIKLGQVATEASSEEKALAADRRENGDMYKASFRIAMKIKRALRMKNMTQAVLADLMKMDPAVLSRYLSGKANMELKTIVKFEKALDINIIDREVSPKKRAVVIMNVFGNTDNVEMSQNPGLPDVRLRHAPLMSTKRTVSAVMEYSYQSHMEHCS